MAVGLHLHRRSQPRLGPEISGQCPLGPEPCSSQGVEVGEGQRNKGVYRECKDQTPLEKRQKNKNKTKTKNNTMHQLKGKWRIYIRYHGKISNTCH